MEIMLIYAHIIKGADAGVLSKIGNSLKKYPELSLKSKTAYEEAADIIATQHKVFAGGKAVL